MNVNRPVIEKFDDLTFGEKMLFGLSCNERIVSLYQPFEKMVADENLEFLEPNNKGFDLLKRILSQTYEMVLNENSKNVYNISDFIAQCYKLAPSDEDYGGIETSLALNVAGSIGYTLKFYLEKDLKYLIWCSDAIFEIINIIKSEKYYNSNQEGNIESLLENHFRIEVETQLALISIIKGNKNLDRLHIFIKRNSISFND